MHLRALVMLCAAALPAAHAFLTTAPVHTSDLSVVISGKHAARVAPRAACRQGVVSLKAQETDTKRASKVPWIVVKDTAARTAFVLNQWKTVAENARSLGWTSSSEEAMMKLRREAATADAMKSVIPKLMQRAVMDKAIQEKGKAPEGLGDIEHLG